MKSTSAYLAEYFCYGYLLILVIAILATVSGIKFPLELIIFFFPALVVLSLIFSIISYAKYRKSEVLVAINIVLVILIIIASGGLGGMLVG